MFFLLYRQKEHGRTRNLMAMILYTAREIQREKKSTTPHLLIMGLLKYRYIHIFFLRNFLVTSLTSSLVRSRL